MELTFKEFCKTRLRLFVLQTGTPPLYPSVFILLIVFFLLMQVLAEVDSFTKAEVRGAVAGLRAVSQGTAGFVWQPVPSSVHCPGLEQQAVCWWTGGLRGKAYHAECEGRS